MCMVFIILYILFFFQAEDGIRFFFSSRRRHTRCSRDWSSDVCSSDLLTASNIGKYPKSCLASGLLRRHVGILPIDKYIGCSWLLPNVSVVVASEYKISDNNLAPVGKDPSVFFHHIPLFCSL